jgi:hypothetical protein
MEVSMAQNSSITPISNANCTATDALGRTLPDFEQTGPPKPNRWVGLFYWQWHGGLRAWTSYNITDWLQTHPGFKDWTAHPEGGPNNPEWYWAEPLYGYYRSTDPWVIRKHLILFADAGVDFLYFDYTNASLYDEELKTFMNVAEDLKSKGVHVPKLTFFLNYEPDWKVEALYKEWYKPGKYNDMWFMWDGKPLLMAPEPIDSSKLKDSSLLPDIQSYFTFRPTWASQDAKKDPTKWRFMDTNPQRPAMGPDGKVEQMVVSKSLGGPIWDNMKTGGVSCTPDHIPVYNDQWVSPDAPKGLFFQYQWDQAEKVAAPILLVTGWNEWTAAVWETPGVVFLGRTTKAGQGYIVDEFNEDFDRDIEPMKGGYNDNFYWQFIANMRLYKGMQPPQSASAPKTIQMNTDFHQWKDVSPLYTHARGTTAARDWDGSPAGVHYTNNSARNNIVLAQAARNKKTLYFHVQTADVMTPATDKNWMMLLLDSDANVNTGWHGYDYLINRTRDGMHCSIEQNVDGKWEWRKIGEGGIIKSGKDMVIAISRQILHLTPSNGMLKFDFKWVDNIPDTPHIMDFYTQGDTAPDARFNYRFEEMSKTK